MVALAKDFEHAGAKRRQATCCCYLSVFLAQVLRWELEAMLLLSSCAMYEHV